MRRLKRWLGPKNRNPRPRRKERLDRPRPPGGRGRERARDSAKAGRTQQAVELLTTLTKSYKGTKTAGEAKEALERPKQNLPLFLDRPTVKADAAAPPEPAPQPPPPQVVNVEPKQAK